MSTEFGWIAYVLRPSWVRRTSQQAGMPVDTEAIANSTTDRIQPNSVDIASWHGRLARDPRPRRPGHGRRGRNELCPLCLICWIRGFLKKRPLQPRIHANQNRGYGSNWRETDRFLAWLLQLFAGLAGFAVNPHFLCFLVFPVAMTMLATKRHKGRKTGSRRSEVRVRRLLVE